MKRTMRVFLGDDNLSVGQLHHAALGAREHASFEYDRPSAPVRRSSTEHSTRSTSFWPSMITAGLEHSAFETSRGSSSRPPSPERPRHFDRRPASEVHGRR